MKAGNRLTVVTAGIGLLFVVTHFAWQLGPDYVPRALSDPPITYGPEDAPRRVVALMSPTCSYCARFELSSARLLYRAARQGRLFYAVYPVTMEAGKDLYTRGFLCAAAAFDAYAPRHYRAYFVTPQPLLEVAAEAGLEPNTFRRCLNASGTTRALSHAQAWSEQLELVATPTFYLEEAKGWRKVQGSRGEEFWKRWLQQE